LLLFGFLLLDFAFNPRNRLRRSELMRLVVGFGLLLVPYFALNHALSGSIFPLTFQAKVGAGNLATAVRQGDWEVVRRLVLVSGPAYFRGFVEHLYRTHPLLPFGALLGVGVWLARRRTDPRYASLFPVLVVLFYAAGIGAIAPFKGPGFQTGRYVASQTGLAVLFAVLGYAWLLGALRRRWRRFGVGVAVVVGGIALFDAVVAQIGMVRIETAAVASINGIQVRAGRWLRDHTAPNAVVATHDIGAIAYFGEREVVDLGGLVAPELIALRRDDPRRAVARYLARKHPTHLALAPEVFGELQRGRRRLAAFEVEHNVASLYDFRPEVTTVLGVILLAVRIEPVPSGMVILDAESGGALNGREDQRTTEKRSVRVAPAERKRAT
jgi:hypothetical protein